MTRRSLVLLPPAPQPATYAAIKASYHAPLLFALRDASNDVKEHRLDVALACSQLDAAGSISRSATYASVQRSVANVYKLLCIIAARERINVEDASGVDVRVLLVSYPRNEKSATEAAGFLKSEGVVTNVATLAKCSSRWDVIYSVESEEGEQILKAFSQYGPSKSSMIKLRGGIITVDRRQNGGIDTASQDLRHFHPAVGGTFDHLHIGHKLLLTMTVFMVDDAPKSQERTITIGITAEDLLKNKKYAEFLEDWHERYAATHAFVHSLISWDPNNEHPEEVSEVKNPGPNGHAMLVKYPSGLVIKYVEIWDPFGPTITEESIDALVISAETRSGGKAVNDKRKEKQWKELDVYEVDVLDAEEVDDERSGGGADGQSVQQAFENKLSSTEIRKRRAAMSTQRSKV